MAIDPHPNDIPDDETAVGGPVADKGEVSRPMSGTDRPAAGLGTTPGVTPDAVEQMADDGTRRELDFDEGRMDDAPITAGESVVDAEYADRGPAEHLGDGVDASAAADVADATAGDRLTGTGLEADADADTPLPTIGDR